MPLETVLPSRLGQAKSKEPIRPDLVRIVCRLGGNAQSFTNIGSFHLLVKASERRGVSRDPQVVHLMRARPASRKRQFPVDRGDLCYHPDDTAIRGPVVHVYRRRGDFGYDTVSSGSGQNQSEGRPWLQDEDPIKGVANVPGFPWRISSRYWKAGDDMEADWRNGGNVLPDCESP